MDYSKMYSSKYQDDEFLKKLAEEMSNFIQKSTKINMKGDIIKNPDYSNTEKDKYLYSVFRRIMNIIGTVEQLDFIPVFIKRFPIRSYYMHNGISHPKFIKYHMENHIIKVTTIRDQLFILVNEVYRLGIPPKMASLDMLTNNYYTKDTKCVKLVKKFTSAIQNVAGARNLITHQGEYADDRIDEINTLYFLSGVQVQLERRIISKEILESSIKIVIKEKVDFLTKNNSIIDSFILGLFQLLLKEFTFRYDKLT